MTFQSLLSVLDCNEHGYGRVIGCGSGHADAREILTVGAEISGRQGGTARAMRLLGDLPKWKVREIPVIRVTQDREIAAPMCSSLWKVMEGRRQLGSNEGV